MKKTHDTSRIIHGCSCFCFGGGLLSLGEVSGRGPLKTEECKDPVSLITVDAVSSFGLIFASASLCPIYANNQRCLQQLSTCPNRNAAPCSLLRGQTKQTTWLMISRRLCMIESWLDTESLKSCYVQRQCQHLFLETPRSCHGQPPV